MDNTIHLQAAMLRYFDIAKPLRGAAESAKLEDFTREQIINMKDALLQMGFLQRIPGTNTSGSIYRTTSTGRDHLQRIKEGIAV